MDRLKVLFIVVTLTLPVIAGCLSDESEDGGDNDVREKMDVIEVTEDIEEPTTWKSGHVYLVKAWDLQVNSDLTIEGNVVVKFHPEDGPGLSVTEDGRIFAKGTEDEPIVFTSYMDDVWGGDTNDDGETEPFPGDWDGVYVEVDGSVFENCTFRYAGPDSALEIWDCSGIIRNSEFSYNEEYAINARKANNGTIVQNNIFHANEMPISISSSMNMDDSNVFTGEDLINNTRNGIFLDHTEPFRSDITWEETEVPFVIDHNDLWIEEGSSLTLGDEVIIKVTPESQITHYDNIINNEGAGVIFTSYLDDSRGGDTNGDGNSTCPSEGEWDLNNNIEEEPVWSNVYFAGDEKMEVDPPLQDIMPVISFWSDPPVIDEGNTSILKWEVYFAEKVLLNDEEVSSTGQLEVSPDDSEHYELRAQSGGTTVSNSAYVLVRKENNVIMFPEELGSTEPVPMSGDMTSGLSMSEESTSDEPIYVRITLDSLYCKDESSWDHGTDSDENYMLVTGFGTHLTPNAWSTGTPHLFDDIDSGENRRFRASQRLVYEGEVPPGEVIGFNVVMFEQDGWDNNVMDQMTDWLTSEVAAGVGAAAGAAVGTMVVPLIGTAVGAAVGAFLEWTFGYLMDAIAGGADDLVDEETVILSYDLLRSFKKETIHKPFILMWKEMENWSW